MTLWGKQAEDYHEDEHAVLAFKTAKVGDFGGKIRCYNRSGNIVPNWS